MNTILEIKNLSKIYKNGRGIKNLSLTVYKGEICGLLGPNGSGKTTTLKAVAGMLTNFDGEISIMGKNIKDNFEYYMNNTGFIFESMVHYNNFTANENLKMLSKFYPDISQVRIDEVLKLVGLTNVKNDKVKSYSLGMRQRLTIAMAIYARPKLFVLDEPLNGLDIEGMIEIRHLILNLAKETETSFLISSHMANEIEKTCSKVCILKEGNAVSSGSVNEILRRHPSIEDYFIETIKNNEVS